VGNALARPECQILEGLHVRRETPPTSVDPDEAPFAEPSSRQPLGGGQIAGNPLEIRAKAGHVLVAHIGVVAPAVRKQENHDTVNIRTLRL
jgi:hypothetical protein